MKLRHFAFLGTILTFFFGFLLFAVVIFADADDSNASKKPQFSALNVSAEVLRHKPIVEKYCREFGISDYVNVILAIMQVESGGTAVDVMQSSESLGLPPNSLSTEESIKQGCKYFSELLATAEALGCDLDACIQSYNYGGGFLNYVASHGGKYSFELAESFSREKAGGEKVDYPNPIAIPINGGWRYAYGNMFYVMLVKQYISSGNGTYIWPVPSCSIQTSMYGNRTGEPGWAPGMSEIHPAIDIGGAYGCEIVACADGRVTMSEYYGGYGWTVKIDHGNGMVTRYSHCATNVVRVGESVKQGQVVALMGGSGGSGYATHLDLGFALDDEVVNPLDYLTLPADFQYIP